MPYIRYYEICRYYKYLGEQGARAFEIRVVLPFPDDWTADDVEKYLEKTGVDRELTDIVREDLTARFEQVVFHYRKEGKATKERKHGPFEFFVQTQLTKMPPADIGWGQLPKKIEKAPITTGFEVSEREYYEPKYKVDPEAQKQFRGIRAKLGGLSKEQKRQQARAELAELVRDPISEYVFRTEAETVAKEKESIEGELQAISLPDIEVPVEYTIIDKSGRYSTKLTETVDGYPASKPSPVEIGELRKWKVPWKK